MTNFSERRIHSAKNRLAHLLPCRNFSVGQEPDPPKVGKTGGRISWCAENFRQCGSTALQKNYSPLATHHSLLAAVLARQEPRPPILSTDWSRWLW